MKADQLIADCIRQEHDGDGYDWLCRSCLVDALGTWQPIETAPKDREILTYRKAGLVSVAAYFPHGEAEWCVTDGMHILNVTHWMPLPEPPK